MVEYCSICLDEVNVKNKKFNCIHENFHKECIKNCNRCPLCRAHSIISNVSNIIQRILIWNEYQRIPATAYKNAQGLNCEIVVINSRNQITPYDIVYHFA